MAHPVAMPELPEVETVCRVLRAVLQGKRIAEVKVDLDDIVLGGTPPEAVRECLLGHAVQNVGRKGKYWWLELDEKPWLFGHLGMSGWIRELGSDTIRLQSHGSSPMDNAEGVPKFLKLLITADDGRKIAFTDGRRLGRLWLGSSPAEDSRIKRLGFDVRDDLPSTGDMIRAIEKRKVSIKGVLLDQSVFAGIGNWIADEVLYQSRIAPARLANSLSREEVNALRESILLVVEHSVNVGADHMKYPESWLFIHRWGGNRGSQEINGYPIVREAIAGRTTAWVPGLQR